MICLFAVAASAFIPALQVNAAETDGKAGSYTQRVKECLDLLMTHGTDTYGEVHTPMLVSILDVESRTCPQKPEALDEKFRVTRHERRSPGGSNLLTDQPTVKAMYGVGYLLYALLQLDQILADPQSAVDSKSILIGADRRKMALDNW